MIIHSASSLILFYSGTYEMIGVTHFTPTLLEAIQSEITVSVLLRSPNQTQPFSVSQHWTSELTSKSGIAFSYAVEPLLQSYLSHANSPSAWPDPSARKPGKAPNPLLIYFGWQDAIYDHVFLAAAKQSKNLLASVSKAEGILLDNPKALYGNYVGAETPLTDIYGDNLPKLRALKAKVDPHNVMGLAGGYKF